jgi:hypothetical protein
LLKFSWNFAMAAPKDENHFSAKEAAKRFEAALRGARVAGHKPMSEIPPKRKRKKTKSKKSK